MAKAGRKSPNTPVPEKQLPLFTAAVRFSDGSNDLVRIKNARDIDDARQVVMDSLVNVQLVLIAELKSPADTR